MKLGSMEIGSRTSMMIGFWGSLVSANVWSASPGHNGRFALIWLAVAVFHLAMAIWSDYQKP